MLIKARFRFPEVLLGVLLTVAIFAMGMTFSSSRRQQASDHSDQTAAKIQTGHKPEPFTTDWLTEDGTVFFTAALVFVAGIQAALFVWQLILLKQTLRPAESAAKAAAEGAEAARLNAEAVMTAEGAQLYPIIKSHNLKQVFGLRATIYKEEDDRPIILETPKATYRFKNYGKTPAKLFLIKHNIEVRLIGSKQYELVHNTDERAIEIIGAGLESADIECEMMAHFKRQDSDEIVEDKSELLLTGTAYFRDFFDRQFICEWRCTGSRQGFKLIRHEQRLDPDKN